MLVVLSKDRQRSSSGILSGKFEGFYSKCMDDNNSDYCLKGVPRPRLLRAATGVQAFPNETAENTIRECQPELQIHLGETRKSMRPEDMMSMD